MSAPIMQNHVTLQIGTILALVSAVAVGAMRVSNIEAKADRAFEEVVETKAQLNELRTEMQRQREILAQVQGDTRAILQLVKLRNSQ